MEPQSFSSLCHETTFISSPIRKLSHAYKTITNSTNKPHTPSPEVTTPTRKKKSIGCERGISSLNETHTISHRMSVDCVNLALSNEFSIVYKKIKNTPPKSIHTPTTFSKELQILPELPPPAQDPLSEETKDTRVPSTKASSDLSKSNISETPTVPINLPIVRAPSLDSVLMDKTRKEDKACLTPLQKSKSPNPFSSWNIDLSFSATMDPTGPFGKLYAGRPSITSLEAYKDFLFNLFGSMCAIKQLNPVGSVSRIFTLEKPKNLKCIFSTPLIKKANKTLVLDLDETLVHQVEKGEICDSIIPVIFPDGTCIEAFYYFN